MKWQQGIHSFGLERSRALNITKLIFSIMDNGHLLKTELEEPQLTFHHCIHEIQSEFTFPKKKKRNG